MIGFQVDAGALELAEGTISMEISSPYFSLDSVPGTITYPFGLPRSPANQVRLNFPEVRADQGEKIAPLPTQLFIDGVLRWVGALVYLDYDEEKQLYAYNFVADAADLASRIDGVSLRSLDLGTVPLELVPDAPDYALPCLRNSLFYDQDKVAAYCHVVNYYRGGYQLAPGGKRSPIVPFLRLIPLLRRVLAAMDYALSGPWLDEVEAQQLIIYSDRAAEDATGNVLTEFPLNRHVPDMQLGDVLVNLQKVLGLAYDFHPVRRELRIKSLRDVVADQAYVDRAVGGLARTTAVTTDGFSLEMGLEDDELNKTLDTGWTKLVVGNGKEVISTDAGTLHVLREADPVDAGRQWLVPAVEAKGASLAFEQGDDSRCGLRLLFDRGLQGDDAANPYPLATWDLVNFLGFQVGESTLHWEGDNGLYATRHQAWFDFLERATTKERTMQFSVVDLLTLDPARKELVAGKKYLWEKISLNLSTTGRALTTAAFTYRYCRL
ncbi:hypothetical protein GO988_15570 [Hymenobacter sp. HMF4947]|uniref:Uncharacterized protein n=1 Tax=Hymenobacter ginkgonis TaxID=2682976 RepID=A0A7K1THD4_9BACT|nr:hypothetical protein [Hymenobacter ginkgonis]MVN77752.1 hypothetical protein [Hymenobacter ginkgonis]